MNIICPKCEKIIDLSSDSYELPDRACDDEEIECEYCEHVFSIGWYATAELR